MAKKEKAEKTEEEKALEALDAKHLQEKIRKLEIHIQLKEQLLEDRNKETIKREDVERVWADYSASLKTGLEKVAGGDDELRTALAEAVRFAVDLAEANDTKRKAELSGKRAVHAKEERGRRRRKATT